MKQCKSCQAETPDGENHDCPVENRTIKHDDSDFLLSMVVGEVTHNAMLGEAVGGDMLGGIVGQELGGGFGN